MLQEPAFSWNVLSPILGLSEQLLSMLIACHSALLPENDRWAMHEAICCQWGRLQDICLLSSQHGSRPMQQGPRMALTAWRILARPTHRYAE